MEHDYILEWFRFADLDILSAERNTRFYPIHMQLVCYLCQQSAEKNLKGFLVYKGVEVPPKIHHLNILCDNCLEYDPQFKEIYDQCESLTRYGVQSRYPHEMEISESDMKKALICARQIKDFAPLAAVRQELEQAMKPQEEPAIQEQEQKPLDGPAMKMP
jgi:HEPN domain-containing protein